jgi:hypothetical protein
VDVGRAALNRGFENLEHCLLGSVTEERY